MNLSKRAKKNKLRITQHKETLFVCKKVQLQNRQKKQGCFCVFAQQKKRKSTLQHEGISSTMFAPPCTKRTVEALLLSFGTGGF
jgi:hypothetical protein